MARETGRAPAASQTGTSLVRRATAPATEHEQMPAVRIALELLLHQQRQAVEALAHVGVAGGEPYPHAGRKPDHRRRSPRTSAATAADTLAASAPEIRSRVPVANSISITFGGADNIDAATPDRSVVTATAANPG